MEKENVEYSTFSNQKITDKEMLNKQSKKCTRTYLTSGSFFAQGFGAGDGDLKHWPYALIFLSIPNQLQKVNLSNFENIFFLLLLMFITYE